MRHRMPGGKILAHFATALGVILIAAALAAGPLGRSPLLAQQFQSASALTPEGIRPSLEPAHPAAAIRMADAETSFRGRRAPLSASLDPDATAEADSSATAPTSTSPAVMAPTTTPPTATPEPVSATAPTTDPTTVPTTVPTATTPPIRTSPPTATAEQQPTATVSSSPASATELRVGVQAGHWKNSELPAELAGLRGSTGAEGKGWREVDINLDIARRVVALLQQASLQVDLIPATVPVKYRADAFVALHGDANNASLSGYKLARARWSAIPERDDALLAAVSQEYAAASELKEHRATITTAMVAYYAFSRNLEHAVAPTTPAVILEMGFLTHPGDLRLLTTQQDRVAEGIVKGILKFLGR